MTNNSPAPFLLPDDDRNDDRGDAELLRVLRTIYAAPEGDGYWTTLEQRIMDRVANGEPLSALWAVPAQWTRLALIAAGFALVVAGSLFLRSRAEMRQSAFDSVLGPTAGPTIAIREAPTVKQATLNYIDGR